DRTEMETASDVASFPCHVVTLSLSPCHEVFSGRGFILFLLGFLGGGITSTEPPLAFIFSVADLETWCARTTSRLVTSPIPRTRTPSAGPFARPALRRAA